MRDVCSCGLFKATQGDVERFMKASIIDRDAAAVYFAELCLNPGGGVCRDRNRRRARR
jgi:hypothetical protein